jgi:hypothetical protein
MRHLLVTMIALLISIPALAEQRAMTIDGRGVVLHDDSTWEYLETEEAPPDTITEPEPEPDDCSKWISVEQDEMTGKTAVSSNNAIIVSSDAGKTGFGIYLVGTPEGIIFGIQTKGAGACIDHGDEIDILFTDGTRMKLWHTGEFNCKAIAAIAFGSSIPSKEKELAEIVRKRIKSMRVWTSDSYVQEDFTAENAIALQSTIRCLMEH